jgi:capsular polysaccharide biosynthesis protein
MIEHIEVLTQRRRVLRCSEGIVPVTDGKTDGRIYEAIDLSALGHKSLPIVVPYRQTNDGSGAKRSMPEIDSRRGSTAVAIEQNNLKVIEVADGNLSDLVSSIKATRFGKFYVKYLKRFVVIRRLFAYAAYAYYAGINHIANAFGRNRVSRRWRTLMPLAECVRARRLSITRLSAAATARTLAPQVFPASDRDCLSVTEPSYDFPDVYVASISQGTIYGGTNMFLAGDEVVCHDLYEFRRDLTSEELHWRCILDHDEHRIRFLMLDQTPEHISAAAVFVDACAHNYAHWLTEVLPRIAAFCAVEKFHDVPLVVNAGLHDNIWASLRAVAGDDRIIITLPTQRAIRVDTLYATSVAGYVPFQRRQCGEANHSQGKFSVPCLEMVRNKVFEALSRRSSRAWPKKVYLRRSSGTRGVVNVAELETLLVARGFVAIAPETLTFMEQVELFSGAEEVIGPTGAAIANAVFCKPGAKICVLMSKHPETCYKYWLNMLAPLQLEVSYVLGEQVRNRDRGIHADFAIKCEDVLGRLAAWDADRCGTQADCVRRAG